MARDKGSYRAARRNYCIREQKMVWSHLWYWRDHRNTPEWWAGSNPERRLNQEAIYVPAQGQKRKVATTTSDVHRMLKQGDYAAAMRRVYG